MFLQTLKKKSVIALLGNSKYKFSFNTDVFDFNVQIENRSFDTPFAYSKGSACLGFNMQSLVDNLLNHGVNIDRIFVFDSIDILGNEEITQLH